MRVEKIELSYVSENCYLVLSDRGAIVIDPGCYDERIEKFLLDNSDKERMILLTHCHFDHIGGAETLRKKFNIKIGIGKLDNNGLSDADINLSNYFGFPVKPFSADKMFDDEETFAVGDMSVKVIHTPGHTKGSVCYLINGSLFSGDMLFKNSYGRTDFPTGSTTEIVKSFYKIINELDGSTAVFSGHGDDTTVAQEKSNNPINYMSVI